MLGSRKFLIALCIVPCILSLVCIGAFAAPAEDITPSVDIPLETDIEEDVVKSPSALAEETFPASPLLEHSYYSYSVQLNQLVGDSDYPCYSVSCSSLDGTYIYGRSFDEGGTVKRLYTSLWSGNSQLYDFYSYGITVNLISPSSSLTFSSGSVQGTLVEESLVPDVADSIFDLGDALITFIMSSWVVMIPLAAWLVILCIGAIRKLVKGV